MERITLQVGVYEVNCSLLVVGAEVWLVDAGADGALLTDYLSRKGLTPRGILLTHGHFDHIGAIPQLQTDFPQLPVYVHPNDARILTHPLNQMGTDYPPIPMPQDVHLLDGTCSLPIPDMQFIETPGHTPGGVCYYFPSGTTRDPHPLLLSGDTLFAGSVGRTDFPGGDMAMLRASLAKLVALPDDTRVVPGHGPETTLGEEKQHNPFLCDGAIS